MTEETSLAVRRSITVDVPQQRAFEVFTRDQSIWWPKAHHIGATDSFEAVVEPREGGRWYERGDDGTECDWGQVLTWEPPQRLLLSWQVSPQWTYDPNLLTEVDVRFIPEGADRTRVELEHRKLEEYGDQAEQMREMYARPDAWELSLQELAEAVSERVQGDESLVIPLDN